jgi:NTE family protein
MPTFVGMTALWGPVGHCQGRLGLHNWAITLLLVLTLGGCASLTVADTKPLAADRLEPPGNERISKGGYRLDAVAESPATPDLLVIVAAMSGGGKRSAAFPYGALKGLRDLPLQTTVGPRPMLGEVVDAIAGVSGGSFTAAYYGLHRDATFGQYETDFLYKDTEANIWGIYLLPWNWTWLVDPLVGTNDFMERVYDREMFHGRAVRRSGAERASRHRHRRHRYRLWLAIPVHPGAVRPDLLRPG